MLSSFNNESNLKSNMDRFIGKPRLLTELTLCYLKSNMDRFIDC